MSFTKALVSFSFLNVSYFTIETLLLFHISVLVYVGECVSGALHWKELVELSKEVGFYGPYLVTATPFVVEPKLRRPLGKDNNIFHFV